MEKDKGRSEHLIENVLGCGRFQGLIVFTICVLTKVPVVYTFMFMSFGNYNPGWRCLERDFQTNSSFPYKTNLITNRSSPTVYITTSESCEDFERCRFIEFSPEASTIVTEWKLICTWKWIPSLIISIQMAGALVGSFLAGQCSDTFGRKKTVYGSITVLAVLNLACYFANSWAVFATLRFFLGTAAGGVLAVYYVLTSEFLPMKWRAPMASIPAWNVSAVLFAVTAMILKDWRHLHLVTAIISLISLFPVVWVPESLRWLEVKNKTEEFVIVANKIAQTNKTHLPQSIISQHPEICNYSEIKSVQHKPKEIVYNPSDLFRPGYKTLTALVGVAWMFMSLIYYAITFGVEAMHGDFYDNLILVFAAQLPFAIFPVIIPNILGRKKGSYIFLCVAAIGLIGATMFDRLSVRDTRGTGTLVMIMVGKIGMSSGWDINKVHLTELYPTVIRGLSLGWACFMARIGGIAAPLLIPANHDTMYICYGTMATLAIVCCFIVTRFEETKGQPLKETFEDPDVLFSEELMPLKPE